MGLYSSEYNKTLNELHVKPARELSRKRMKLILSALNDCKSELLALYPSTVSETTDILLEEFVPKLDQFYTKFLLESNLLNMRDVSSEQ